jgi:hypothetical protein
MSKIADIFLNVGEKMGKIISKKLATKDSWIFSKSFHVFTIRKKSELKKKGKPQPKEKK